ncbi:YdcH family protein [Pyruvatibacter sp.]
MTQDVSTDDAESEDALRAKLVQLRQQHRDMDAAIDALEASGAADPLRIRRLKKMKLAIRDEIGFIEDQLVPDIIA